MNRLERMTGIFNNSGLASQMTKLQMLLVSHATKTLYPVMGLNAEGDPRAKKTLKQMDMEVLDAVGPAAASSAVEYAIRNCRKSGILRGLQLNGSFIHNQKLIANDVGEGYADYSSVLREFLLPRYAYLDFDQIVDPRHPIDQECGYPKFITPIMYRYMYDRDDMARRLVDIYPDESWAVDPEVRETMEKDPDKKTEFEQAWENLCEKYNLLQYLYRMDKMCGIGHYGVLLLGVDDGQNLEQPIDELELLAGIRQSVSKKQRGLMYLRPFDEYLSFIHQYETDVQHPRYGLPKYYNLVFLDMTIDAAGASIGTRLNRRVHWSRVVHVADNLQGSLVFGIPRMQSAFNRLLDLRKIKGGSAEMFWKGAFPGINFEVDPRLVEDNPEFDEDKLKNEIEKYSAGLQRYLTTIGIKAHSLASQIPDSPGAYVDLQTAAVAAHNGIPLRIFLGSEEGRLASSQDKLTWNQRLARRSKRFTNPELMRNFIDRLIAIGIMPPPKTGRYFIDWDDLNTPTDEDKANLSLKWTQALSQYVATGMIHLIQPMDYLTLILGLHPAQAKKIVLSIEKNGGWTKLKSVDPSQGTGINGKRENLVTKGEKEGTSGERPEERDTATKSAEGKTS